jgi:hypothetical protein
LLFGEKRLASREDKALRQNAQQIWQESVDETILSNRPEPPKSPRQAAEGFVQGL